MTKIKLSAESFTVALDKLYRDDANARLTDREANVPALAENLALEGLLQNLGVRAQMDDEGQPTGRYGVVIGGRRLAALQLLAKAKRLAKSAPIPCFAVADKAVTSASLAENQHRVAMHPADAYVAFAKLADEGMREKAIAARFGISPLTVQRRMRLGRLSPVLLDALRSNAITDQVAQAYAITTDHEAQERVYGQMTGRSWIAPQTIRDMLTEGEVPANDRRARLVGTAAYEAAGGTVRRDLFSDDNEGFTLTDPALLDKLVLDKLEAEAARLRAEGWQDVQASLHRPDEMSRYATAQTISVPLSDEDSATLDALAAELDALAANEDGGEAELTDEEDERSEELQRQIDEVQARQSGYSDDTKAKGKAFVFLDYSGLRVAFGIAWDADDANADEDAATGGSEADEEAEAPPAPTPEEPAGLSATLELDLCAQRTVALQAQVAERPDLALRLLAQSLLLQKVNRPWEGVVKMVARESCLRFACPGIEDTKARRLMASLHESQACHTPGESGTLLPWLMGLTNGEVLTILAPLVASSIEAGHCDWTDASKPALAAQAAVAADLDMRDYWQATPESYFSRVSKAQIARDMREGGGGPVRLDDAKAAIAATAARQLGSKRWVPTLLRLPTASVDAASLGADTPGLADEGAANDDANPLVQAAE